MKGLWQLTWLEIKIFVREPLGLFGTVGVPVLVFLGLGRADARRRPRPPRRKRRSCGPGCRSSRRSSWRSAPWSRS